MVTGKGNVCLTFCEDNGAHHPSHMCRSRAGSGGAKLDHHVIMKTTINRSLIPVCTMNCVLSLLYMYQSATKYEESH